MKRILFLLVSSSILFAAPKKTIAFAWSSGSNTFDNLIPAVWLKKDASPEAVQAALDKLPAGYRVLFREHFAGEPLTHPDDMLTTASGAKVPGLWPDNGVSAANTISRTFFEKLKALGGAIDYYILDYENGMNVFHNDNNARRLKIPKEELFTAIMNDPRFAAEGWPEKIGNASLDDLCANRYRNRAYKRWETAVQPQVRSAVEKSFIEPMTAYFPAAKSCNYGMFYDSAHMPDGNGHTNEFSTGYHAGTHQSSECYGRVQQLGGREYAGRIFGTNAFRSFIYSVNQMRTMKISSSIPVLPWISYENFTREGAFMNGTPLFHESVVHIALCDPEVILYWNPRPWAKNQKASDWCDDAQDARMSALLEEIDSVTGYADRKTLVRELTGWYEPFVLTGMSANGKSIWRFTPDIEIGKDAAGTITSREPLTFSVKGATVTIPGGKVFEQKDTISRSGVWIIAPIDARPVITR